MLMKLEMKKKTVIAIMMAFLFWGSITSIGSQTVYAKTVRTQVSCTSEREAYKKAKKGINKADFSKLYVCDNMSDRSARNTFDAARDHNGHGWWILYQPGYKISNSQYLEGLWYGNKTSKKYIQAESRAAKAVAKQIMRTTSGEYQRIKAAHDYLCQTVTYDLNADERGSAYSALVCKRSVCLGYANALDLILDEMGIKSIVVQGRVKNGEGHAWNVVYYKGKMKYIDATWDDHGGYADDTYFMKDESFFKTEHIWNKNWHAKKYLKWD